MKKIIPVMVLAALCLNFTTHAQGKPSNIAALNIGDKVPDITISNIINYKGADGKSATTAKISDFKGKLLILDFWATYCTPCIKYLPELQQLQERFNGKLQVLLVSPQQTNAIQKFLENRECHLPSVTKDTVLTNLFRHAYIPHEIWIRNGVVLAVTQPWLITSENIQKALSSPDFHLPVKNDKITFDGHQPFLVNGNGGDGNNILFHSILTGYVDGLAPRTIVNRDSSGAVTKLCMTNRSLTSLYKAVFSPLDPGFEYNNRILINVDDSLKHLFYNTKHVQDLLWLADNGFCYEIIIGNKNLYGTMRDDLNRYFGATYAIRASLQKRTIKCLVLSRNSGSESYTSTGGASYLKSLPDEYTIKNLPISLLLNNVRENYKQDRRPIIDETGITGNVDFQMQGNINDLNALKKGLNKCGLDIQEENRAIEMLVITNQPAAQFTTQSNP